MSNKTTLTSEDVRLLCDWFQLHQRTLPWRHTNNPYDVWLSEIMLQQTRVDTVIDYFLRFKNELPTIENLAECDTDRLMKLWEGLGYYSRARNLQKCAQVLVSSYGGKLPDDIHALQKLPGIGPYTSGAIASLAFHIPAPAVDGNVLRVMARLFGITEDIRQPQTRVAIESLIQLFYDSHSDLLKQIPDLPSQFNQGLMELGALVCVPNGNPKCDLCPWAYVCHAHLNQMTDSIPYRSKLKEKKQIPLTVLVIRHGDHFLLHKRPEQGLLAGLYEFINCEGHLTKEEVIQQIESMGYHALRIKILPNAKHVFTHLTWQMIGYEIRISDEFHLQKNDLSVTKKELHTLAVPTAFSKYLKEYDLR